MVRLSNAISIPILLALQAGDDYTYFAHSRPNLTPGSWALSGVHQTSTFQPTEVSTAGFFLSARRSVELIYNHHLFPLLS